MFNLGQFFCERSNSAKFWKTYFFILIVLNWLILILQSAKIAKFYAEFLMHLFLCISKNNSYTVQYEYVRPQIPLLALETLGSIFEHFFQNPRITHHFVSIKNPYQNKISKVKIIRTPFYTFLKRWKIFKVQHQNEWN